MSRGRSRRPHPGSEGKAVRRAQLLREVIADELTLIDDERLSLVSITTVDVDPEMNRAVVYFDSMFGEEGDAGVLEALGEHRIRIQSSINRQVRAKKTPVLDFRPDQVIRDAERIDRILREGTTLPPRPPDPDPDPDTDEA